MTGSVIVVYDRRRKDRVNKVVIEPGDGWLSFNLASIGADDPENLRAAILHGPIGTILGGDPRPLSRQLEKAKKKQRSLATEVEDLQERLNTAQAEVAAAKTTNSDIAASAIGRVKVLESELEQARRALHQLRLDRMKGG
ncbi:hypothetical protein GAY33_26255 [Azospirillum brasilense]|uniref:hypothetical protein n=1 Tax=Azospirillum argentinense TaxID=2970906 RepID=UPI00190EE311|nr:hypothetical protein [Azospirillum argentinense]MBK3802667.1 hypothetical protein [Azospirillum argentinense]